MKIKLEKKYLSPNKNIGYLLFKLENNFSFQAGQFVMLEANTDLKKKYINNIPNEENAKLQQPTIKRAYSIACSPSFTAKTGQIAFYIKRAWTFSSFLLDADIDIELELQGPYGHFVNDLNLENYLFISVWSGLAPIIGLFEETVEKNNFNKIVNLHGERLFDNLIPQIIEKFNIQNSNIKNMFFLSREEKELSPPFYKGHIQDWLSEVLSFFDTKEIAVFICWKSSMVNDIKEKLINAWIKENFIKTEKYW